MGNSRRPDSCKNSNAKQSSTDKRLSSGLASVQSRGEAGERAIVDDFSSHMDDFASQGGPVKESG